jgi:hypothetical protein
MVALVDPASPIAALSIVALIVFHLVLGWKAYRLAGHRERSADPERVTA